MTIKIIRAAANVPLELRAALKIQTAHSRGGDYNIWGALGSIVRRRDNCNNRGNSATKSRRD